MSRNTSTTGLPLARSNLDAKREALHQKRPLLLDKEDKNRVNTNNLSILKPYTEIEASYKVFEQAIIYPNLIRIYKPFYPIVKILPGMESRKKKLRRSRSREEPSAEDIQRSLRRTKKNVKDYAACNQFDLFATFTMSPKKADRYNQIQCKTKMVNWIKNEQRRKGKFAYLVIPEFHADKKALHFHCLFQGYAGQLIDAHKKINGRDSYKFKSYHAGWNSALKIDTNKNLGKVGTYISKYITKDMPIIFGQRRYYASHRLKKPIKIDNPHSQVITSKPINNYVTEYGHFTEYPNTPLLTSLLTAASVITKVESE